MVNTDIYGFYLRLDTFLRTRIEIKAYLGIEWTTFSSVNRSSVKNGLWAGFFWCESWQKVLVYSCTSGQAYIKVEDKANPFIFNSPWNKDECESKPSPYQEKYSITPRTIAFILLWIHFGMEKEENSFLARAEFLWDSHKIASFLGLSKSL